MATNLSQPWCPDDLAQLSGKMSHVPDDFEVTVNGASLVDTVTGMSWSADLPTSPVLAAGTYTVHMTMTYDSFRKVETATLRLLSEEECTPSRKDDCPDGDFSPTDFDGSCERPVDDCPGGDLS